MERNGGLCMPTLVSPLVCCPLPSIVGNGGMDWILCTWTRPGWPYIHVATPVVLLRSRSTLCWNIGRPESMSYHTIHILLWYLSSILGTLDHMYSGWSDLQPQLEVMVLSQVG